MEKFPQKKNNLGSKVRTWAGAVGLSALSMLGEAEKKPTDINALLKLKPDIEYTRNDILSFDSTYLHDAATSILKNNLLKENLTEVEAQVILKTAQAEVERKMNEVKKVITFYDLGRQWVLENIKDPHYGEKLQNEIKESYPELTDKKISEKVIREIFLRHKESSDENFVITNDMEKSRGSSATLAFYSLLQSEADTLGIAYFRAEDDMLPAILNAVHEYSHKVTRAEEWLTPKAIGLFQQAFDSTGFVEGAIKKIFSSWKSTENIDDHLMDSVSTEIMDKIAYYSDPTEMYARKKVFDYDLERLGVKKYGEEFTEEHYQKVLELMEQGKLSDNSEEFLMIIKPDMIMKIMNEIADADFDEGKFKEIA